MIVKVQDHNNITSLLYILDVIIVDSFKLKSKIK